MQSINSNSEQLDLSPTSQHPFIGTEKRRTFVYQYEGNSINVNVMTIGAVLHFSITETGGFAAHILAERSTVYDTASYDLKTLLGNPTAAMLSLTRRLVEVIGQGRSILVAITLKQREEAEQMKLAKDLYSRLLDECVGI